MLEDEAFFLELAKGTIPIRFHLGLKDTTHPNPPEVVLALPRNSYFPLHLSAITDTFDCHTTMIPGVKPMLWLEWNGQPVPWHLPVGVVYDRLLGASPTPTQCLRLQVNYSNFPRERVVPVWESGFEYHFRHVMKASVCCMYDKSTPIMQNPSPTLFNDMDLMLKNGDGQSILKVHRAIKGYGGAIHRHPIILHVMPQGSLSFHGSPSPVPEERTLQECLQGFGISWESCEAVVVHGLRPLPTTSLRFVVNNLGSADMAVHIIIHLKPKS